MIRIPRFTRPALAFGFFVVALAIPTLAQLETRAIFRTDITPVSVVTADFNHDGKIDVAVTSVTDRLQVQVFLGNGDGTFALPISYPAAGGAMAVADLNHDGNPDLVVVNEAAGVVGVLLGNGDGTFQAPVNYATPAGLCCARRFQRRRANGHSHDRRI